MLTKIKTNIIILTVLFNIILNVIQCKDELVMVQLTHRHGARYPIFYTSDSQKYKTHFGELTNIGMRELFQLGRYLKKSYRDTGFLENKYKPKDMSIYSTDRNRTFESVTSLLQGLYGQGTGGQIDKTLEYITIPPWNNNNINIESNQEFIDSIPEKNQVFPIHYIDQEILVGFDRKECPFMKKEIDQNENSDDFKQIINSVDDSVKKFCEITGEIYPTSFDQISNYMDTWYSYLYFSPPYTNDQLEQCMKDKQLWEDLNYLYNTNLYAGWFRNQKTVQLTSTPFYKNLFLRFSQKLGEKNKNENPKFIIYSSHDTTVLVQRAMLKTGNFKCIREKRENTFQGEVCIEKYPLYGSQIIYELYKREDEQQNENQHYIKIKDNGTYIPIEACNWQEECDYSQFQEYISQQLSDDYDADCERENVQIITEHVRQYKVKVGYIVVLSVLVLFLGVVTYGIFHYYKKRNNCIKAQNEIRLTDESEV